MLRRTLRRALQKWGWTVTSGQADEGKVLDTAQESDDFDAASDLCDFGFVLLPAPLKPAPETGGEENG